jgi:DNA-binding response OmpR family regulator
LRRRLPAARLIAVVEQPQTNVASCDALLQLPLHAPEVTAVLTRLLTDFRGHQFQHGPILLDMDMRTVVTPKGQYHMTPKQAQLLYFFLVNHNQVLSRRDIMQRVWDTSFLEDTRTLDVHIRWLRERIELNPSEPSYLVTVRGRGYRLSLD